MVPLRAPRNLRKRGGMASVMLSPLLVSLRLKVLLSMLLL